MSVSAFPYGVFRPASGTVEWTNGFASDSPASGWATVSTSGWFKAVGLNNGGLGYGWAYCWIEFEWPTGQNYVNVTTYEAHTPLTGSLNTNSVGPTSVLYSGYTTMDVRFVLAGLSTSTAGGGTNSTATTSGTWYSLARDTPKRFTWDTYDANPAAGTNSITCTSVYFEIRGDGGTGSDITTSDTISSGSLTSTYTDAGKI